MKSVEPCPEPEYDNPKEVWAFFGLASYRAQVLERGLLNFVVGKEYLSKRGKIDPQLYDDLYAELESRTLGPILNRALSYSELSAELGSRLRLALERRNYMIHAFFWTHSEDLLSESGRMAVIDELRELADLFGKTDADLDVVMLGVFTRHGGSLSQIEAEFDRIARKYTAPH